MKKRLPVMMRERKAFRRMFPNRRQRHAAAVEYDGEMCDQQKPIVKILLAVMLAFLLVMYLYEQIKYMNITE